MLEKFLNSFEITPNHIKIFFITFVAMSVMVCLQRIGVHSLIPILSLDK